MKVAVVVFPGSNCDHDVVYAYSTLLKAQVETVWHRDRDLGNPDVVVVPGGFAYGDYLRTGALAKLSPVMEEVKKFADKGGQVIGICNGFQILCEAQLLPGALLKNRNRQFLSRFVNIKVQSTNNPFTANLKKDQVLACPVAHFEGNYFADEGTIKSLEDGDQVLFRYCAADGTVDQASPLTNPNGSINAIAGITNQSRNVLGMMPHPERALEGLVSNSFGAFALDFFKAA